MLDEDIVAVSPSTTYRVLSKAGRLDRWNPKPSKKGTGFVQPLRPHEHWHTDIACVHAGECSGRFRLRESPRAHLFLALSLIKMRPPVKSRTYVPLSRLSSGRKKAKLRRHAPCSHLSHLCRRPRHPGDVSAPIRPRSREFGSPSAGYGAKEGATQTTHRRHGPSLLGSSSRLLARVGKPLGHRQRRYGREVESGSIPTILGEDLAATLSRPASDQCRDSSSRRHDGTRRLGRTANPRGAHEARFHRLRDHGVAIHAAAPSRARPSEAMDSVLAQPQGRHRRDGSVRGTDRVASAAVRLLRHRARPATHRSLQRHDRSRRDRH